MYSELTIQRSRWGGMGNSSTLCVFGVGPRMPAIGGTPRRERKKKRLRDRSPRQIEDPKNSIWCKVNRVVHGLPNIIERRKHVQKHGKHGRNIVVQARNRTVKIWQLWNTLCHGWETFGHVLETFGHVWETFGNDWETFGHVWETLGHVWETFGHVWDTLGNVWETFRHVWDKFGHVWETFGHVWDTFVDVWDRLDFVWKWVGKGVFGGGWGLRGKGRGGQETVNTPCTVQAWPLLGKLLLYRGYWLERNYN